MSQPQSTVLNGPNGELTMAFKDAQPQDMNKPQPPGGTNIYPGNYPRPPLQRNDSRANLQPRPNYPNQPNQQNPQFRPPLRPQFPQQFQRPPGPQNLQNQQPIPNRPPLPNQQQQQQPPRPIQPNLGPRPGAPVPRPQPPRPPGIYPQKTFPPPREENKTLDTAAEGKSGEDVAPTPPPDEKPALRKSLSLSSNPETPPPASNEPRRVSISSIGSVDNDSRKDDIPSRPESRASTKMNKIEEEEKNHPPSTLPLAHTDKQHSTSPSPQPDSVIEIKPKTEKPKTPEPKIGKSPIPHKAPSKKEGDNDSGVDESTQGNDVSSNGDHSPRKSLRNPSRLTTPTKNRSFSRGSRSPNLKSPDSTPSTPGASEKKKLPMNKIQVGSAPSPNLKVVKSKIGSLANASHKPGGGNVKIEHKKIDISHAQSRIGAKNENYVPSGGDKKIISQKLQWSARSKIGSLDNTAHKPKGGDKKIESVKLDFKDKAKSKVGSKDNIKHQPGGGDVKSDEPQSKNEEVKKPVIENKKLNIKVESKVGSMDNVKHKPGGGDKKIFDDKDYLRQTSGLSNDNNSVTGSQDKLSVKIEVPVLEKPAKERLKTVPEIVRKTRPPSSLSRSNSLRKKRNSETPRPSWKY